MVILWRGRNLPDMRTKLSLLRTEGSKTPKNYFVNVKCCKDWMILGRYKNG
jgi:hypothetical protein